VRPFCAPAPLVFTAPALHLPRAASKRSRSSVGERSTRLRTRRRIAVSSFATRCRSPLGLIATSRCAFEMSIPTNTAWVIRWSPSLVGPSHEALPGTALSCRFESVSVTCSGSGRERRRGDLRCPTVFATWVETAYLVAPHGEDTRLITLLPAPSVLSSRTDSVPRLRRSYEEPSGAGVAISGRADCISKRRP